MKLIHAAATILLALGLAGCKAHSNPNFGGSGGSWGGSGGSGGSWGGSGGSGGQLTGAQEQDRALDACYDAAGREKLRVLRVLDTKTLREGDRVVGADVTMRVSERGDEFKLRCRHTASTGSVSLKRV